jgi:hypothetical protein
MIKMHTHTTLITHTQLFSALIVNWEEEKIKKKKKKSFHRYNPRGCFIFSHRKRMEREEEGEKERKKEERKNKEKGEAEINGHFSDDGVAASRVNAL